MFQGLFKFVVGSAVGAAIGAGVASLMAPKSGEEFQADTNALLERARTEGDQARMEAEAAVAERFRQTVNDPSAFGAKS
ncbi:MAG: YtxH domain-containing protein [Thermomicrobiales bacterium]|nr:YtxH domain-containing protein [Thermomicrobiales bacterium]